MTQEEYDTHFPDPPHESSFYLTECDDLPCIEAKQANWGWHQGRLVTFDYSLCDAPPFGESEADHG